MLDIKEGDYFVYGGKDYPVRSCAEWQHGIISNRRFTVTANTKRRAATNLTGISCTLLWPVDAEIRTRPGLDTPHELLQVFVDGTDIFYHLILEDLKR